MAKRRKGKLELDWVDKGDIILTKFDHKGKTYPASYFQGQVEDEELMPRELELIESVGDPKSENMLIWGENLIALKTIARKFKDQVKIIYLDPPYNTLQQYPDYNDDIEHSVWLAGMENRLEMAEKFLMKDGVIFVQVDQSEMAYLKVEMDSIFGRNNYVDTINVQMRHPERILKGDMDMHQIFEYILFYIKKRANFKPYKNIIKAGYTKYVYTVVEKSPGIKVKMGNRVVVMFKKGEYEIRRLKPNKKHLSKENIRESFIDRNSSGRFFAKYLQGRLRRDGYGTLYKVPGIGADGLGYRYFLQPMYKKFKNGNYFQGYPLTKLDFKEMPLPNFIDVSEEMASSKQAKEGGVKLPRGKKSESLLYYLFKLCKVSKGDLIMDFFSGTSTTGAVAHKLGCKYIMVEIKEKQAKNSFRRLKNVVNGDPTGISKEVCWKGGGGFKFYKLGEPLIVRHKDYHSIKIINPKYYNTALIKVICTIEGFKFRKSDKLLHGVNRLGNKYAHITEQYVSQSYIGFLKSKLADNEEMIIYCFSYDERITLPFNMIVKKLPTDLGKAYQLRLKV